MPPNRSTTAKYNAAHRPGMLLPRFVKNVVQPAGRWLATLEGTGAKGAPAPIWPQVTATVNGAM